MNQKNSQITELKNVAAPSEEEIEDTATKNYLGEVAGILLGFL